MIDLRPHLHRGDGIVWGQAGAEPVPLIHAVLDQVSAIGPLRAFAGYTLDKRVASEVTPDLSLVSYGALGALSQVSAEGRLAIVPCNYSDLPRLFAERLLPGDVALVQVSPPDAEGYCSLGIGVEYLADALPHASRVIAEINEQMPTTIGGPRLHVDSFTMSIRTDRPLAEVVVPEPQQVDQAIGEHVAGLIDDGDTFQIGVGSLPTAVLRGLRDHANLGVHSGMITDDVVRLWERGVITGRSKDIDGGVMVTGAALGTAGLYRSLADMPVEFRAASYTHAPAVLARIGNLISVNSALQVDLSGRVGSETVGGRYLGAVGGQADFSRAASTTGGRSIIALRSTARDRSTIVPALDSCGASMARTDVDFVVTEHGVAALRGRTLDERAASLVAIAAPEHREHLMDDYEQQRNTASRGVRH